MQNGLPYLLFFEGGGHTLLVIDLSLYGLLIYMFVVFDKDVELELVLGKDYIQLCSDSETYQVSIHGKLRLRPKQNRNRYRAPKFLTHWTQLI